MSKKQRGELERPEALLHSLLLAARLAVESLQHREHNTTRFEFTPLPHHQHTKTVLLFFARLDVTSELLTRTMEQAGEKLRAASDEGRSVDALQLMSQVTLKVLGRTLIG